MLVRLRDYQVDVLERARGRMRQGCRRVLIQAPTGSGKSVIAAEAIRACVERGKRAVFFAHRRRLVSQMCERLEQAGVSYGILMNGVSRTSAPVQVVSRDTAVSRAIRNPWIGLPPADLVVIDEAHNLGDGYDQIVTAYRDAFLLGFTATPTRADGRGLYPQYLALECTVPVSRLVQDGFLVRVNCYAPEGAVAARSRKTDQPTRRRLAGDPVSTWKRYAHGRPTIVFAAKVDHSVRVVEAFNAAGVRAEHLDARSSDEERDAVIERVRAGKTQVVSNCMLMTEGVDIPELACCILLRLAGSYVTYAQACGRIMRPHPSKTDAVLIDHSGAVTEHGFPDEDVEWSLNPDESVDRRIKKAKEEGKRREPVVCANCAFIFSGAPACPACGTPLPRRREKAPIQNELLVEVPRDIPPAQLAEQQRRFWQRCLAIMAHRNGTPGAAARMFKEKFGDWPSRFDLPNLPRGAQWHQKVAVLYPQFLRRG